MADIASFGAYIPVHRLARKDMGEAWDIPAVPGERAVANADEDSITMAVAASVDCLQGIDPTSIDAVHFATTTAPYHEKQCAPIIASALDMRRDIFAADFTDSIRAATTALRAAADAVASGSAKRVLVVAADARLGEPETPWEQMLGDGAGAVLVTDKGAATMRGFFSLSGDHLGPWRRAGDRFLRSFEARVETQYGYAANTIQAAKTALEREGVAPGDIARAVITGMDPRSHAGVARSLGIDPAKLQDTLFFSVGHSGAAQVLIMLAGALEASSPGDKLLVANYGDGSDAFLLDVKQAFPAAPGRRGLNGHLLWKQMLPHYTSYVASRKLVEHEEPPLRSSEVTYWRDARQELNFHGARCKKCGAYQYPFPRVCTECGAKDEMEDVKLAKSGSIYTFTLDHLSLGMYLNVPIPRVVIDLDGGGRVFLEMTDCDPKEVKVGMPVELTFRRLHEGSDFHNYYWKCRPTPQAA
jgi:3-hydroxy-3-methylglutaryl CoA synthase